MSANRSAKHVKKKSKWKKERRKYNLRKRMILKTDENDNEKKLQKRIKRKVKRICCTTWALSIKANTKLINMCMLRKIHRFMRCKSTRKCSQCATLILHCFEQCLLCFFGADNVKDWIEERAICPRLNSQVYDIEQNRVQELYVGFNCSNLKWRFEMIPSSLVYLHYTLVKES